MSKKLVKLTLALSILIGGLEMGVAAREAQAACVAYECCDYNCNFIRYCYELGPSTCVCELDCRFRGIGIDPM